MKRKRTRVLFVCVGNLCRSPTAEVVFRTMAKRAGFASRVEIDSAGLIDWHVGDPPDYRAIAHAAIRGYDLKRLRARQVTDDDFRHFDWILAMEQSILDELEALRPAESGGRLARFLDFVPDLEQRDVPDPYDAGDEEFETMLDLVERGSVALVARIFGPPDTSESSRFDPAD